MRMKKIEEKIKKIDAIMREILNEAKNKRSEKETIEKLKAIVKYFENNKLEGESFDVVKAFISGFEIYDNENRQENWENFLSEMTKMVDHYIQNPFIRNWKDFDLEKLMKE